LSIEALIELSLAPGLGHVELSHARAALHGYAIRRTALIASRRSGNRFSGFCRKSRTWWPVKAA
jgi:hypothetical protein